MQAALGVRSTEPDAPREPDEAAVRAHAWSLLGALLAAPPGADLLGVVRAIEPVADTGAGGMAAAWEMLRLAGEQASVESLDDEYHDLFIGLGRGEVMPYGSWYLTGFVMDRPLAVLRGDLADLGFARQEDVKEPEDHAAALCEVMALLAAGPDASVDTQRDFFQRHLWPWMKTFFLDLQKARTAGFYRAVGHFGEQFLELEHQYLTMLV